MKKILIIGAGAMGAAFSIPLIENRHHVTLSEPHNIKLISKLNLKKKFHPSLKINLPKKIKTKKFVPEMLNLKWDLIVVAVSSVGIEKAAPIAPDPIIKIFFILKIRLFLNVSFSYRPKFLSNYQKLTL